MDTRMSRLIVEGGLGVHGRRPFVRLVLDDGEAHMDVEHALALADRLRGAAYGALGDAATVEALGGERLTTEEVAAILARLRAAREVVDERERTVSR